MEFRWLGPDEIEHFVNPVCRQRGWMQLNINDAQPTCRVLGAFDGVTLAGFFVLQMCPVLGPFWADEDHQDGTVSRELADRMDEFLVEAECRGVLTVATSEVSSRLAQRHGMKRVDAPVYEWVGAGG